MIPGLTGKLSPRLRGLAAQTTDNGALAEAAHQDGTRFPAGLCPNIPCAGKGVRRVPLSIVASSRTHVTGAQAI
jgi:hypothetical protein